MKFRKRLEPTLPQGSRIPVDRGFWDRLNSGGHVTYAANGSWVRDAHSYDAEEVLR